MEGESGNPSEREREREKKNNFRTYGPETAEKGKDVTRSVDKKLKRGIHLEYSVDVKKGRGRERLKVVITCREGEGGVVGVPMFSVFVGR